MRSMREVLHLMGTQQPGKPHSGSQDQAQARLGEPAPVSATFQFLSLCPLRETSESFRKESNPLAVDHGLAALVLGLSIQTTAVSLEILFD